MTSVLNPVFPPRPTLRRGTPPPDNCYSETTEVEYCEPVAAYLEPQPLANGTAPLYESGEIDDDSTNQFPPDDISVVKAALNDLQPDYEVIDDGDRTYAPLSNQYEEQFC